jgi:retron-type reverse transcriptase
MDTHLNEAQMGFRPGRSCSDALFNINQLTNWSREYMQPLFTCFVDLKKAYDYVNKDALWYVLGR